MSSRHQRPAEAFPYSSFVREEMIERHLSLGRLARAMGCSVQVAEDVAIGRRSMDQSLAEMLSAAFSTSPEYWVNLDAAYQDWREAT